MTARGGRLWGVLVLAGLCIAPVWTQESAGRAPAADLSVPADLKPLLAAPQSEMRLVTLLYNTDRTTLNGDFDTGRSGGRGGRGGREGGQGRGAAAAVPQAPGLSVRRVARLKRFDMDWQAALAKLDASKLSAAARADLTTLKTAVAADLTQLDSDAAVIAELAPLMPFATTLLDLSEARIRLEDVDSRKAAGQLTAVTRQIAEMRARLEKDPGAVSGLTKEVATRGADAVDGLRNSMTTWFNFSNSYDPVFTWWMGMPFQQLDAALQGYAVFLRQLSVPAGAATTRASTAPIAAAPAPAIAEVPDLEMLMRPSAGRDDADRRAVRHRRRRRARRCRAWSRPGKCGRRPCRNQQPWVWPSEAVLHRLARRAEDPRLRSLEPQRAGRLPVHQERQRAIPGPRRCGARSESAPQDRRHRDHGRGQRARGAAPGSRGRNDPVHARAAHRARREGIRVVRRRDAQGLAADGIRRRLEAGAREGQRHARRARPAACGHPRHAVRSRRLRAEEGSHHRAGDRERVPAHVDDDARGAAREPVLPRRRADHRVVSDEHDGVRRAPAEHARQQHSLLTRDGLSRDDPGAQPGRHTSARAPRATARGLAAARRSTRRAGRSTGSC